MNTPTPETDVIKSLETRLRESEAANAKMREALLAASSVGKELLNSFNQLKADHQAQREWTTIIRVERDEYKTELATLRRKVVAAEGMEKSLRDARKQLLERNGLDRGEDRKAAVAVNVALTSWQEANK